MRWNLRARWPRVLSAMKPSNWQARFVAALTSGEWSLPSAAGHASRRRLLVRELPANGFSDHRPEHSSRRSFTQLRDDFFGEGIGHAFLARTRGPSRQRLSEGTGAIAANIAEPTDRPLNFILVAAVRYGHHDPADCWLRAIAASRFAGTTDLRMAPGRIPSDCHEAIRPELAGGTESLVEIDECC